MKTNLSLAFSQNDVDSAMEWGFNCGPAAFCAVLGVSPEEARRHLHGFESKGYTNPTLMLDGLRAIGAQFSQTYRSEEPHDLPIKMTNGLIRIQWSGPWTRTGVPIRVRYRHSHWIAMRDAWIFDVNAMRVGGWVSRTEWILKLAPWLIKECVPKGDGGFWPTHCLEVKPHTK